MIVLDTNVLSEALRPLPDNSVLDWLAEQPRASLFITTVTRGEILDGIRLLSDGKRRRALLDAVALMRMRRRSPSPVARSTTPITSPSKSYLSTCDYRQEAPRLRVGRQLSQLTFVQFSDQRQLSAHVTRQLLDGVLVNNP